MRRKPLFIVALALLVCFSLAFSASAQTLSPQEMLLEQIKELGGVYSGEFYNKSSGSGTLKITRFSGSLLKELGELNLEGCVVKLNSKLDTPDKKMSVDFIVNYKGKEYPGQLFLDNNKLILDKSILKLVEELVPEDSGFDLNQLPQYLYLQDKEVVNVWKTLADYRDQQMPVEMKELMRFFLEAIPSKHFHVTPTKFTLELDQTGWEEVLYNLVEKVKNEKERFAGIIADIVAQSAPSEVMLPKAQSPEEMKAEIKADITQSIENAVKSGDYPTREDVRELAQNFRLKEFRYQASLLPGGAKELKAAWIFADQGKTLGELEIHSSCAGTRSNFQGATNLKLNLLLPDDNIRVNGALTSNVSIQGQKANSRAAITARAADEKTGGVYLDAELVAESADQVDPNVKVETPKLTPENSLNLTALMPGPAPTPVVLGGEVIITINGQPFFTEPPAFIDRNGRTMVPARALAEALGCKVEWIETNKEVRVTKGDQVVRMYIGQSAYTVNGTTQKMDTAPIIVDDRTFVPLRFVVQELGVKLDVTQKDGLTVVNVLTQ